MGVVVMTVGAVLVRLLPPLVLSIVRLLVAAAFVIHNNIVNIIIFMMIHWRRRCRVGCRRVVVLFFVLVREYVAKGRVCPTARDHETGDARPDDANPATGATTCSP
jgi:hypothetical protein